MIFEEIADIENYFSFQYINSLEFYSTDVLQKIQNRCKKKLQKQKIFGQNQWNVSLCSEDLQKSHQDFFVKKVHPLVGFGVFTKKIISEFTCIGEYVGIVRKRRWFSESKNDYVFGYVIGPKDTPWVIDAQEKGNLTRFINHSYSPNLISKWTIFQNTAHILFYAKRTIFSGEQLTYDYGPYYWRKRPSPINL